MRTLVEIETEADALPPAHQEELFRHLAELPVRVHPDPSSHNPANFQYENIMKFEEAIILETWLGCEGNIA